MSRRRFLYIGSSTPPVLQYEIDDFEIVNSNIYDTLVEPINDVQIVNGKIIKKNN
jgi:hypothetical protein